MVNLLCEGIQTLFMHRRTNYEMYTADYLELAQPQIEP